jgi:hypothetical protein
MEASFGGLRKRIENETSSALLGPACGQIAPTPALQVSAGALDDASAAGGAAGGSSFAEQMVKKITQNNPILEASPRVHLVRKEGRDVSS